MTEAFRCPECREIVSVTLAGTIKVHKRPPEPGRRTRERCSMSQERATQLPPEKPECPSDTDTDTASSATCSKTSDTGDLPSTSPGPLTPNSPTETSDPDPSAETIPQVDQYVKGMEQAKAETPPLFDRPRPLFDRPRTPKYGTANAKPVIPMEGKAAEVAGRMRELFYAYSNRMDRNQQPTMGPSEAGSPCDRRIAMSLMRLDPVNPGGDGWASFVGTQIHRGLEDMLLWANAGSGRYQTEVRLEYPNVFVPFGTTDLIDTALLMVDDHKAMGSWSLNKLRTEGPNRTYRVQAHIYGMGAKLKGFDIKDVAIIGWPRDKSDLSDLYVWTEPYDPSLAREALDRVARIGETIEPGAEDYKSYAIDPSDCRFCPFYLKGAAKSEGGVCNGRE